MSIIHINQLKNAFGRLFSDSLDTSDIASRPLEERKMNILSRQLAAYALMSLANIDAIESSKAIVDGFDDNGIDALYYDRAKKTLWLVQSKWIEKGNGEPGAGEIKKFTSGVRDLVTPRFDRFNQKIKAMENTILEALDDPLTKIRLVAAYTGKGLAKHSQRDVDDILEELNDVSEVASFQIFQLKDAYDALAGSLSGSPIDLEIALKNWGQIDEPYKAFYGQVEAQDIANWLKKDGERLFSNNIRSFIGRTDINDEILATLTKDPQNFFYFNNGITAVCHQIEKKLLGGGTKEVGVFVCKDISVVNGAQTVGCIGKAHEMNKDKLKNVKVLLRLISLNNYPEDLAEKITRATNTQNKIEKRDFVSLDPEQSRLATELKLENVNYSYIRTDEILPMDDANCSLEEATIALACKQPSVSYSVLAKREIGKFWDSKEKQPYNDIFNSKLSSLLLWRAVQVLRDVNKYLKSKESASTLEEKAICIHGNRFILHMVMQECPSDCFTKEDFDMKTFRKTELPSIIEKCEQSTYEVVESDFKDDLKHLLFRNYKKCQDIMDKVNPNKTISKTVLLTENPRLFEL